MPTKFSEVYERAVFKFTDYAFLDTVDTESTQIKKNVLGKYLLAAIADFQHGCNVDLNDYDLKTETFNKELTNEIIDILSDGVAYHWLEAKAMNSELFRNIIHNSDYKSYSPANLLKEIKELRDAMRKAFKGKINTYSFRFGSIGDLKV